MAGSRMRDATTFALLIWLLAVVVQRQVRPCEAAATVPRRHNIVMIVVDDLSTHVEPFLDETHPLKKARVDFTPNLKKLAKESVVFRRAYAQNAACNPSRASMLTSRTPLDLQLFTKYPLKNLAVKPQTLPQLFKSSHHVVGVGKIFHREIPGHFEQYAKVNNGDKACGKKQDCVLSESKLVDSQVVSRALSLARQAKSKAQPMFLIVGFHRPHWQYSSSANARQNVLPAYDEILEQTKANNKEGTMNGPHPGVNGSPFFAGSSSNNAKNNRTVTVARAAQTRSAVFASTQWMDVCVGRLMAGLKSIYGNFDDMIIIVVGDNGVMMFDRAQSGKSVLFNAAKHVPLFIRHPDYLTAGGTVSDGPVELMDIMPTLMESEEVSGPRALAGRSLMPLIRLMAAQTPNSQHYQLERRQKAGIKVGAITIESRCTNGKATLSKLPRFQSFNGAWVACHQLANAENNRAEMLGFSIQTKDYNYIEWRVAQWEGSGIKGVRWDSGGLWARELYDYSKWTGQTTLNNVEYEARNVAPCPVSCYPRSLNYPVPSRTQGNDNHRLYYLPEDRMDTEYEPPDLDHVQSSHYVDVVRRLSLLLRSTIRDKDPVCSGHGLINPFTGECDDCIPGWRGLKCEIPDYAELASEEFTFPPTFPPTHDPTFAPTHQPTTERPSTPTSYPTWHTRAPTKKRKG